MIKRTTRIRKSRGLRRGPWRSEKYRRYVASHPCAVCGNPQTQAAHTVNNGMSSKGPDYTCVPLCYVHHMEYDAGRAKFEVKYGTDLVNYAAQLFAIWEERQAAA